MKKYITEFQKTGNSTINVELVCKDWDCNRFSIATYAGDNEDEYTFIIKARRRSSLFRRSRIPKEQALAVVNNLGLVHVKDAVFNSGGCFYSESRVHSLIEQLSEVKQEKVSELSFLVRMIGNLESSLTQNKRRMK